MGYTKLSQINQFIPPSQILKTAGTWTPSIASKVASEGRTAADASFGLLIPIPLLQSDAQGQGAKLQSIDLFYKIATAAADDVATVELEKIALPATGAAPTGAAVTTTCDTGHDTAAERKAVGDHTMTVTLTTPEFMDQDYAYMLYILVDAAANTAFTLYGARVNFDLVL
jgi:hypothetical protein